jgi:hypothetical protein
VASLTVYFSPGGDDPAVFPVAWNWAVDVSGNPVTIELTAKKLNLHVYSGAPLHGVWNGFSAGWSIYNSGYWAAVLSRFASIGISTAISLFGNNSGEATQESVFHVAGRTGSEPSLWNGICQSDAALNLAICGMRSIIARHFYLAI